MTVFEDLIVAIQCAVFLVTFVILKREQLMPVSINAQPIIDELTAAADALPGTLAAVAAKADAQAAEDLAAIKTAADALSAAIAAASA